MGGLGRRWWAAVGCVALTTVACSAPPTLDLEVSPSTIKAGTGAVVMVVHATTGSGLVGSGNVTVTSSVGSARLGLAGMLDHYGSFRASLTCLPAEDPGCDSSQTMNVTVTWGMSGRTATAEASVRLLSSGATETACDNGKDDDVDGLVDCDDPDCEAQRCTSADKCLTGSTCSQRHCVGGQAVTCTTPRWMDCQATPGTCDHALGCVYAPKNVGGQCTDNNLCTSNDRCDATGRCVGAATSCPPSNDPCLQLQGVCDPATGSCSNPPAPNGTSCGAANSARCCSGSCTDTSSDPKNCGECGLTCAGACVDPAFDRPSCNIPSQTTGLCVCGSSAQCPVTTSCSSTLLLCIPGSCFLPAIPAASACTGAPYCHYN
jgi:hypothetical protein